MNPSMDDQKSQSFKFKIAFWPIAVIRLILNVTSMNMINSKKTNKQIPDIL